MASFTLYSYPLVRQRSIQKHGTQRQRSSSPILASLSLLQIESSTAAVAGQLMESSHRRPRCWLLLPSFPLLRRHPTCRVPIEAALLGSRSSG